MALDHLGTEDLRILRLESPTIAGHTCKVVVLDGELEAKALRRHVHERLGRMPRCRQRLRGVPLGLAAPVWVDDPSFDLAHHIRPVAGPGEVGERGLSEIVARLMSERLDRARPLWAIDVVERLADGGAALVWRIHHCMVDGVGAVRMAESLLWDGAGAPAGGSAAPPAAPEPSPGRLVAFALGERARGARNAAREALSASASPRPWLAEARRFPRTLARELAPKGSESPLDCRVGAERRVAFTSVELGAMKRVEKAFGEGTTVNDVALAIVAGALREWLAGRGTECRRLRVKVPVSMHRAGEHDALGNRDSFMFVDLPVAEPDPVERLLEVNAETRVRKRLGDARTVYDFFNELSHLAPPLYAVASRIAMSPRVYSLSVSNVPGPREPVSVMNRQVRELYSLAEIAPRHALRVSIISLAGRLGFGLCADADALPDLDEIATAIPRSLGELEALAS